MQAHNQENVFQTKKLPASINQINTKFALKAAVTPLLPQKNFWKTKNQGLERAKLTDFKPINSYTAQL